mgnify:CR=1 FL=1
MFLKTKYFYRTFSPIMKRKKYQKIFENYIKIFSSFFKMFRASLKFFELFQKFSTFFKNIRAFSKFYEIYGIFLKVFLRFSCFILDCFFQIYPFCSLFEILQFCIFDFPLILLIILWNFAISHFGCSSFFGRFDFPNFVPFFSCVI